jgi:hypothetical protein
LKSEISNSRFERLGTILVLALVPLMLLALPLPPTKGKWAVHKQDWILGGAIAIAAASLIIHFLRGRRGVMPLIVFGAALMLTANVTWNKAFRSYVDHHKHKQPEVMREVFRKAMHQTFHWPVYGRYDNAIARLDPDTGKYSFATLPFVLLSTAVAAMWFWWAKRRGFDRKWCPRSLAVLMAFQLALIVCFAACEPWPERFSLKISGYNEFKKDIPRFTGVADTLRNYVHLMPSLEWYGQHYPPGNLILLEIEKETGITGLTKSIVVLLTVLSVIPLHGLTRELELDDVATSATLLFFAASTGVLVYCTINTTSLLLFPGTLCLWMLARALRTGAIAPTAILGLSFAFYLFFSFSASILGVLMTLVAIITIWQRPIWFRQLALTAIVAGAVLLIAIALLYAATKFNLIGCFDAAVRGHHEQQGNGGFDDPKRYLQRSTGNIIAYLMSTVPLCVLAVLASIRRESMPAPARALVCAVVTTIVIAGFSGLFYVETERIWIFLTPFLALAAGIEAARREASSSRRVLGVLFLLVLLVSCSQEFLFLHYR